MLGSRDPQVCGQLEGPLGFQKGITIFCSHQGFLREQCPLLEGNRSSLIAFCSLEGFLREQPYLYLRDFLKAF